MGTMTRIAQNGIYRRKGQQRTKVGKLLNARKPPRGSSGPAGPCVSLVTGDIVPLPPKPPLSAKAERRRARRMRPCAACEKLVGRDPVFVTGADGKPLDQCFCSLDCSGRGGFPWGDLVASARGE